MLLWPCIVSKAWRKNTNKMQQYRWFIVNCRYWLLTRVSTCFGHLYAHHQEEIPRVTAYGVYLLVLLDVADCGTVVLRWGCDHCEGCCNTNKMQPYRWFIVNCRFWLLTTVSTCFGHLYAHHQEERPRVTAYGVYLLVLLDVAGCGTVVLRWGCDHCEGCCKHHNP